MGGFTFLRKHVDVYGIKKELLNIGSMFIAREV
jgi:hypothetical protein